MENRHLPALSHAARDLTPYQSDPRFSRPQFSISVTSIRGKPCASPQPLNPLSSDLCCHGLYISHGSRENTLADKTISYIITSSYPSLILQQPLHLIHNPALNPSLFASAFTPTLPGILMRALFKSTPPHLGSPSHLPSSPPYFQYSRKRWRIPPALFKKPQPRREMETPWPSMVT